MNTIALLDGRTKRELDRLNRRCPLLQRRRRGRDEAMPKVALVKQRDVAEMF